MININRYELETRLQDLRTLADEIGAKRKASPDANRSWLALNWAINLLERLEGQLDTYDVVRRFFYELVKDDLPTGCSCCRGDE